MCPTNVCQKKKKKKGSTDKDFSPNINDEFQIDSCVVWGHHLCLTEGGETTDRKTYIANTRQKIL